MKIGYTTGVFDLFHIGHLNLLRNAKARCDHLIVGVTTDHLCQYKNKNPVIPFDERIAIISSIKEVDSVIPQSDMEKAKKIKELMQSYRNAKFIVFVGDDWKNTDKWEKHESELKEINVEVVYLPYTKGTSSTLINQILEKQRGIE